MSREPSADFANGDFRKIYRNFLANAYLMMMYLYEDDLLKLKVLYGNNALSDQEIRDKALKNIKSYEEFLMYAGPEFTTASKGLIARVGNLVKTLPIKKNS
jgi:hypothetical protein